MMIDAVHDRWLQTPAEPAAEAGALRRKPRLDGRAGRVRLAARHRADGLLLGAVGGPAERQPAVERPSRCGAIRAPRRSNRATTTGARCGSPRPPTPPRSLDDTEPPWEGTRVLFLQHPSDPIVWWSPDLLFTRPDWLKEPPGRDRTASMRWYPIVTFWQVAADMTNAAAVPGGHGHNYGDFGARRLGGRRTAGRLDRRRHRTHPASRWRSPPRPTDPNTSAHPSEFVKPGAGAGGGAGRLEWSRVEPTDVRGRSVRWLQCRRSARRWPR